MTNEKVEKAKEILLDMAGDVLLRRVDRLRSRRFVFFRLLRVRLLLRKIRLISR